MPTRKLDKKEWRSFLDRLSTTLEGKQAEIEVVSLQLSYFDGSTYRYSISTGERFRRSDIVADALCALPGARTCAGRDA